MPEQPKQLRGFVSANGAVLLFGLAGVLGKLSLLPAPLIVFGRSFFAGLVLLAVCWLRHVSLRPKRSRVATCCLERSIARSALDSILSSDQRLECCHWATLLLELSIVYCNLEPLLLHQRPSRIQIVAGLLILPGIFLLVPSFTLQNQTTLGVMWGVLSGASFALLSVTNRWLGRTYSSLMMSCTRRNRSDCPFTNFFFTANSFFWTPQTLLILFILGCMHSTGPYPLYCKHGDITAQTASLLVSLEPVWGIIFGIVLLGAIPTTRTLIGGAIIISAILLPGIVALGLSQLKLRGSS